MVEAIVQERPASPADIASPAVYSDGIPHEGFAAIRGCEGLVWHPYEDNGFWAVTRHAEVREVSKNPGVFSSAIGHTNLWDLEADALEARRSLIDSDAPDHARLRRVVSRVFTPRAARSWEGTARDIAAELVDEFLERGGGDWVELVAAPLPIRVILAILGVPAEDADYMVELTNHLVEGTGDRPSLPDDAYGNVTPVHLLPFNSPASHALFEYGERMRQLRIAEPADDLVTGLVTAEADGERLTPSEYRNFFQLLVFAGNETTRTVTTNGMRLLMDQPDQLQRLVDDPSLIPSAVEEILRFEPAVHHFRRTATEDTEIRGRQIKENDPVIMWYAAANRDEEVFEDPDRFDVARHPNEHLSFGIGEHFCLGANLARLELNAIFEEIVPRLRNPGFAGPVRRLRSNFINGVKEMPVRFDAGERLGDG